MTRFLQVTVLCAWGILAPFQLPAAPADKPELVPSGAALPSWPAIAVPALEPGLATVRSQDLEVLHAKTALGGFVVRVRNRGIAAGSGPSLIGYVKSGELRWLDFTTAPVQTQSVTAAQNELRVICECADPDAGSWRLERRFRPGTIPGAIEVQTDISASQDRSVAFLPMLLLFPGVGSFGAAKAQGLFAGLEYLENEPSSSEADVIGPAAQRQVPDNLKITFPLMAVENDNRYVALSWQMRPFFSALFDSPDRLFHSGGHVLGLLFPGSDGRNRREGSLLPRVTEFLHAGQTVSLRATILGGQGPSVIPAVQQYMNLRALPPVPGAADLPGYAAQTAGGWLDSKIREGNLVRHAVAGDAFKPQPAADAALWMEWLAPHQANPARAARLRQTATNLLAAVSHENLNFAGVGHIRYPAEALVFGHVKENAEHAGQAAQGLLANFEPDGSVKYRPKPGGPDYAKTDYTNEASGLASRVVVDLLEAAAFSGNHELIDTGLERLRALDRFHNGVPRGAQTWECPLHTPDILASAQMVRAYTLGYQLTGQARFLEEARVLGLDRSTVYLSGLAHGSPGRPLRHHPRPGRNQLARARLAGPARPMVRAGLRRCLVPPLPRGPAGTLETHCRRRYRLGHAAELAVEQRGLPGIAAGFLCSAHAKAKRPGHQPRHPRGLRRPIFHLCPRLRFPLVPRRWLAGPCPGRNREHPGLERPRAIRDSNLGQSPLFCAR